MLSVAVTNVAEAAVQKLKRMCHTRLLLCLVIDLAGCVAVAVSAGRAAKTAALQTTHLMAQASILVVVVGVVGGVARETEQLPWTTAALFLFTGPTQY